MNALVVRASGSKVERVKVVKSSNERSGGQGFCCSRQLFFFGVENYVKKNYLFGSSSCDVGSGQHSFG